MTDWHRLFGLILIDYFTGSPFAVDLEKDLSLSKQFLDVIILRKASGEFAGTLPDGLAPLAAHNLITFKSHHEKLDDWALKELTGHYVNYRKQASLSLDELLPEEHFRLYGVCARFPQNLARDLALNEVMSGVYDCQRGSDQIRIIVASQVAAEEQNAVWHLFSAAPNRIQFGAEHYRMRSDQASTILGGLFSHYKVEGFQMPYTMEDYQRDYLKDNIHLVPLKDRLKGLTPDDLRKAVPAEDLIKAVPAEDLIKAVPAEDLIRGLLSESQLKDVSAADLERLRDEIDKLLKKPRE